LALTACGGSSGGGGGGGGGLAGGGGGGGGGEDGAAIDRLKIVVPADPGGGWDQTGRAMQQHLQDEGLVGSAQVSNVTGAGGTVGLAQLANEQDPNTLMVMGLVMVGAVETNAAQVRLEDTTPIAKLTEEPLVVVVPASSPYQTLEDLVTDVVATGQEVAITGGSAGGADQILAATLIREGGVPAEQVASSLNYIAYSGGGESLAALLGEQVDAGISGVGEYAEQVEAGELRALAVSSAERSTQLPDTPTIVEAGYDVELTNWRGVVAPGSVDAEQQQALVDLVTQLHDTPAWEAELEERGWTDAFVPGEDFGAELTTQIEEVRTTLTDIGLVTS
ncbi:MAG: Tricarboxylate transport protein TctC, partial [uncultured Quadrisphaera sp.]